MVSDNTQVGCGILTMPSWYEGAQSVQENIQNTITPLAAAWTIDTCRMGPCFHIV